jgi:hypothetical protein
MTVANSVTTEGNYFEGNSVQIGYLFLILADLAPNTGKMMVMYLHFFTSDEKTEGSGPNGNKLYQNSVSFQILICYCRSQILEL